MSFHPIDLPTWDRKEFYEHFTDVEKYSSSVNFAPKPGRPPNSFDISMIPLFTFTAFNINVYDNGKYFDGNGKRLLPLAIQVHHAVCDGYHIGKFVKTLQELIEQF